MGNYLPMPAASVVITALLAWVLISIPAAIFVVTMMRGRQEAAVRYRSPAHPAMRSALHRGVAP